MNFPLCQIFLVFFRLIAAPRGRVLKSSSERAHYSTRNFGGLMKGRGPGEARKVQFGWSMGVAILSPVQIDVAGKKIISRRGGIEDDAGFRIEKTESNGHHKDARSDQDALRCAVNRFARQ